MMSTATNESGQRVVDAQTRTRRRGQHSALPLLSLFYSFLFLSRCRRLRFRLLLSSRHLAGHSYVRLLPTPITSR